MELTTITRERMNGKPVFNVPARSVVNFDSGFGHKLLCDSLTFTAGTSCAFSCTFCYVEDLMRKSPHLQNIREQHSAAFPGEPTPAHSEIVIRRHGALNALHNQLTDRHGKPKFADPKDTRVLYMSPLVDVAGNIALCAAVESVTPIVANVPANVPAMTGYDVIQNISKESRDLFIAQNILMVDTSARTRLSTTGDKRSINAELTGLPTVRPEPAIVLLT